MPCCPKCGKEVSAEASYCPACGANLRIDKDLLREKIAETRHNEIGASIVMIMGVFIGAVGLYVATIKARRIEWHGLVPYEVTYSPYANLAILLFVLGIIIVLIGGILGTYSWYQRSKLMRQLERLK